jgi:hypothetical protein
MTSVTSIAWVPRNVDGAPVQDSRYDPVTVSLLTELDASYLEHRRCGNLDGAVLGAG